MTSRKQKTPKVNPVSWTDTQNPNMKGWMRSETIRGRNDKLHGKPYHLYYSPDGRRFRSLKQARIYMKAQKNTPVEVKNTIVSPPRLIRQVNTPICMIGIANDISHNDFLPLPLYNHFRTTERTSGGGIHIRWFDY